MGAGPACPECGSEVQPNWHWCHRCGFDPDGLRPQGPMPAAMSGPHRAGLSPALVVGVTAAVAMAVLALGAAVLRPVLMGRGPEPVTGGEPAARPGAASAAPPASTAPNPGALAWLTYASEDGRFRLELPGRPTTRGNLLALDRHGERYLTQLQLLYPVGSQGGGFELDYGALPDGQYARDAEQAFEQHVRIDARRSSWQRIGTATVDGLIGVEFTGSPDTGLPVRGILFTKGPRVYVLIATGMSDADYVRFRDSFRDLGTR